MHVSTRSENYITETKGQMCILFDPFEIFWTIYWPGPICTFNNIHCWLYFVCPVRFFPQGFRSKPVKKLVKKGDGSSAGPNDVFDNYHMKSLPLSYVIYSTVVGIAVSFTCTYSEFNVSDVLFRPLCVSVCPLFATPFFFIACAADTIQRPLGFLFVWRGGNAIAGKSASSVALTLLRMTGWRSQDIIMATRNRQYCHN